MRGPIALVGGSEWKAPAVPLDSWLLSRSESNVVTIVPTATARGRPDLAVETAANYFAEMGAKVDGRMVLTREDADDESQVEAVEGSRFIYLAGGDPGYLAKTLRDTGIWRAILKANESGAVLAGSSAGAMVMFEEMLRPIGRSKELGLGLLKGAIVIPHHERDREQNRSFDRLPKLFEIAGAGKLIGIDECTGLVIDDGRYHVLGAGSVCLYEDGKRSWKLDAPAELEEWI